MSDPPTPRTKQGRPPLTSRPAILAAAREIGCAQLTVGAVTTRVGVKYSTFYRHFPTLDALLTELVDEVLDRAELPAPDGDWSTYLRSVCAALFDLFTAHSGLVDAAARLPDAPARLCEVYQHISDLALAAGATATDATLTAHTALDLVTAPFLTAHDHDIGVLRRRPHPGTTPVALDPGIRAVLTEVIDDPPRDWTARKIDLLITGLTVRLPAT